METLLYGWLINDKHYDLQVQCNRQQLPLPFFYFAYAMHVFIWPEKVNAVEETKDDFLRPELAAPLRLFKHHIKLKVTAAAHRVIMF